MPLTGKTFYQCFNKKCLYFNFYLDAFKVSHVCPKCGQNQYFETDAESIVIRMYNKQELGDDQCQF